MLIRVNVVFLTTSCKKVFCRFFFLKLNKNKVCSVTSSFPIPYMAKFCVEASSEQKDSKISKADQKFNTEIVVRPLYLSPTLH